MARVESPATTDQMRSAVAHRLSSFARQRPLVVSTEYHVGSSGERAFRQLIATLSATIRKARGHVRFSCFAPLNQGTESVVRYMTYEEWSGAESFLEHWRSDELRRQQLALIALQARPPRLILAAGEAETGARPAAGVEVLWTGQERTWDRHGKETGVPGADGDARAGRGYSGVRRFVDNGNGTVTDMLTDLTWLKNANSYGEVTWEEALKNSAALSSGAPGLHDGSAKGHWRLPNVNEMQSLLSLDNSFGPALEPDSPFLNLEASNYWTSSSVALSPALGWFVALAVGPPVFDLKMNRMRMWPVKGRSTRIARTGQRQCFDSWGQPIRCAGTGQDADRLEGAPWPPRRFTDNNNGTVSDELTGLVWLQDADAFGRLSWPDAIEACNRLADGQHDLRDESEANDWRLPNVNELRSLIDYSQAAPALPEGHPFRSVQSSLYWSSTTVASAPRFARFVFLGVGPSVWDIKSVQLNVWPVRNQLPGD